MGLPQKCHNNKSGASSGSDLLLCDWFVLPFVLSADLWQPKTEQTGKLGRASVIYIS